MTTYSQQKSNIFFEENSDHNIDPRHDSFFSGKARRRRLRLRRQPQHLRLQGGQRDGVQEACRHLTSGRIQRTLQAR
jgi:hypothetical protein